MGSSSSTDSPTSAPTPWPTLAVADLSTYNEAEAYHTLSYAYATYCDEADILNWDCWWCVQTTSNFDITSNGAGIIDTGNLLAFMGYDNDEDRIVLSFRGTAASIENWINNLDMTLDTYPHYDNGAGYVHSGFYDNLLTFEQHGLSTMIKSMFAGYPGADILLTGPSLGAAMAELVAFDMLHNPDYSSLSIGTIRVIDYGAPRWCDETIATRYNQMVDSTWRVVNEHDAAAMMPPQALGYHHPGTMVHYLSQDLGNYVICDSSGEEEGYTWLGAITGDDDCWLWQFRIDSHMTYFGVDVEIFDLGCPSGSYANAAPLSMIQEMERELRIPDKVPTVDVVIVAVTMFVVFTLWRCGFRCSIWRKQQKPYKRVDLKGDVASDSDTDVDVQ